MKVIDAMMRIHTAGVMHCDFDERHVLINSDNDIRIIDFNNAHSSHCCERVFDIEPYEYIPRDMDYGCLELWEIASEADIWVASSSCSYSHATWY